MSFLAQPNLPERVALGLVSGWKTFRKFGMNADIAAGTEHMWPVGTARVLPTTSTVAACVSSSTADDSAAVGTGAWTIQLEGLDANGRFQTEVVALDGQVSVNGVKTFSRINRAYVLTAGTGEINAGNISISLDTGKLQAYIEAAEGQTHQVLFTVPSDKTLLINRLSMGTGRLNTVDLAVLIQIKPSSANSSWRSIADIQPYESSFVNEGAVLLPASTEVRAVIVASGAGEAFCILSGYEIDPDRYDV